MLIEVVNSFHFSIFDKSETVFSRCQSLRLVVVNSFHFSIFDKSETVGRYETTGSGGCE